MAEKPLTDEMVRILRAASEGRLLENESGRYVIPGEPRPDRRSRELLRKRGLIEYAFHQPRGWVATEAGVARLAAVLSSQQEAGPSVLS